MFGKIKSKRITKNDKDDFFHVGSSDINKFLTTGGLGKLNKALRIDKWSPVSLFLLYLGLFGIILLVLSFFIIPWGFLWIYSLFAIIVYGVVFTRPGKRFNITLVLAVFLIILFIPSNMGQIMLSINPLLDSGSTNYLELAIVELEELLEPYLLEGKTMVEVRQAIETDETFGYVEFFGIQWTTSDDPFHGYLEEYIYCVRKPYNSNMFQKPDFSALLESITNMPEFTDPIEFAENLNQLVLNLMNIINWVVFFFIIGLGGSTLGDFFTGQFGNIAKKVGIIALTITVMVFIYSVFLSAGVEVLTIFDTLGESIEDLLKLVGLAQLDVTGNTIANTKTVVNGVFSWIPFIVVIISIVLAVYFRKKDFNSILFAKYVLEDDTIEVKRSKFSPLILVIIVITIIYVVGYNLLNADPIVNINPIITLTFYVSAMVILMLLGMRVLILNKSQKAWDLIKKTVKWTFFGIVGLYLYFGMFQPYMFSLGLIDYESGLLALSQGFDAEVLNSPFISQFFLVAMPETLIFQIAVMGVANRVYFRLRRGKLLAKEEDRLEKKKTKLANQLKEIPIDRSITKKNLRNLAKRASIQKKVEDIDGKLYGTQKIKLPMSYFILPSLICALAGSFFFSDYHRFRRGISLQYWWQNPTLGLNYMGAGFFLSLISFFSWIAGVLVHWLNNCIALLMYV